MGDDISIGSVKGPKRQIRIASHIFVHTNYNIATMKNDIGVVRLSKPFVLTDTFQPITYGTIATEPNKLCSVSGWGATYFVFADI